MKAAQVSIIPKWHFYGITFFERRPINLHENSTYPVYIYNLLEFIVALPIV